MELLAAQYLGEGDLIAPVSTLELAEVVSTFTWTSKYGIATEIEYRYLDTDVTSKMRVTARTMIAVLEGKRDA